MGIKTHMKKDIDSSTLIKTTTGNDNSFNTQELLAIKLMITYILKKPITLKKSTTHFFG